MDDLLEVTVSQLGIGVTRRNDLSLFGEAKATVDAARRLGTDGTVGGSSPARNCPAATMEDCLRNTILLSDLRDLLLCLIQRPVRRDIAPILVDVRITDHHDLFIVTG